MRYERVTVKRDTQTTYVRDVPAWEIPLLEFIFEDGNVKRTGDVVTTDTPYPDAAIEFDRLARAYGADPKSDMPHVVSVYGDSGRGVRELRAAIAEAEKAERAEKAIAAAPRGRGRPRKATDSLMA